MDMAIKTEWLEVHDPFSIPRLGARTLETQQGRLAIFRTAEDAFFALRDACPHRGGPLSQGIVHGHLVTCPLHNWVIELQNGEATGPDEGCSDAYPVELRDGRLFVSLPTEN